MDERARLETERSVRMPLKLMMAPTRAAADKKKETQADSYEV
jgi:hypothetical protein